MRIPIVLGVVVLGLTVPGCKPGDASACDARRVDALVTELAETDPHDHPRVISEGLPEACTLPPFLRSYLSVMTGDGGSLRDPPSWSRAGVILEQVCPGFESIIEEITDLPGSERRTALYERCDLGRHDLVSLERYLGNPIGSPSVWAAHHWLGTQGVGPEQAKALSRALLLLERSTGPIRRPEGLPRRPLPGPELAGPGVLVRATVDELTFEDERVTTLNRGSVADEAMTGHVIQPLFESLDDKATKHRLVSEAGLSRLWLAFDERVRFSTLFDTMYTASVLEFEQFGLVVETDPFHFVALPVSALEFAPMLDEVEPGAPLPPRTDFLVLIRDEGLSVAAPGRGEPRAIGADLAALREQALAHCDGLSVPPAGVIRAENHIEVGVVVDVILALRGPACGADGSGDCCLPKVIIDAGAG